MSEANIKTAEEKPAEEAAEKKAAGKIPGFKRKKEYTVLVDIKHNGKLIPEGKRGALSQLSDKQISEFVQAEVIV